MLKIFIMYNACTILSRNCFQRSLSDNTGDMSGQLLVSGPSQAVATLSVNSSDVHLDFLRGDFVHDISQVFIYYVDGISDVWKVIDYEEGIPSDCYIWWSNEMNVKEQLNLTACRRSF